MLLKNAHLQHTPMCDSLFGICPQRPADFPRFYARVPVSGALNVDVLGQRGEQVFFGKLQVIGNMSLNWISPGFSAYSFINLGKEEE